HGRTGCDQEALEAIHRGLHRGERGLAEGLRVRPDRGHLPSAPRPAVPTGGPMKSYEVEDAGREAAERLREEPDYWDEMAAMFETPPPLPFSAHEEDRKSTRLNSSHVKSSYAVFCL